MTAAILDETTATAVAAQKAIRAPRRRRDGGLGGASRPGEGRWGWLFVSPAILLLLVFLIVPILLSVYVSFTNWNGQGGPFSDQAERVGLENYRELLVEDGLTRRNFIDSVRNNLYFVLFVVPIQTMLALFLALVLNQRRLAGKGFFRTAFYMPSVSSSIAIGFIFLFLFQQRGAINAVLSWFGAGDRQWFNNGEGTFHAFLATLGVDEPPAFLEDHGFLGMEFWEWLSGPSWSMVVIITLAIWTTSGTFMLMFLSGLQAVPEEVHEAAAIDGAGRWQTLRHVTVPLLKRHIILVVTLGLIGTWQVFDQIYIMSDGAGETMTPAYLTYTTGIREGRFGRASALAFILFFIILVFTVIQRLATRDKDAAT
jgi:multiple sugar transport system permease protein